jgi:hypothetical protein
MGLIRRWMRLRHFRLPFYSMLDELTDGDLPKCSFEDLRRHVGDFSRHRKEAV